MTRATIKERLVAMLAEKGYTVDIGPNSAVGYWRINRAECDVVSWDAWAFYTPKGENYQQRVQLVCDFTMTECVKLGFTVEHTDIRYAWVEPLKEDK